MLSAIAVQELFSIQQFETRQGRQLPDQQPADPIARAFGTAMPNSIAESSAWRLGLYQACGLHWRGVCLHTIFGAHVQVAMQQKELFSISEDSELGLMQAMVGLV
jgi:hypothetical protein